MLEVVTASTDCGCAIVCGALADELLLASHVLGELAYDLGSNNETLRRHMTSIQSVDQITQHLVVVADLLRGGDIRDLISMIPLADMADRLKINLSGKLSNGDL